MNNKFIIVLCVCSFIVGISLVSFVPINMQNVSAELEKYYQETQAPVFHKNDYLIDSGCDWLGNNCSKGGKSLSDDDKRNIFDNWCYSINNQYTYSVGKSVVTQYFRTMSHDCTSYIIDEKLKPINEKLDNLTKEIEMLRSEKH